MKTRNRFLLSMLIITFLFVSSFGSAATTVNSGSVHIALPDASSGVFQGGTIIGKLDPTTQMHATVSLRFSNQSGLNNLLAELQTPSSGLYHKFLTHDQFIKDFSPSSSEYNGYVQYFRSQGFSVQTYSDRASIDLIGSTVLFETTFHTSIDNVAYLGNTFYAPITPLWISYGSMGNIAGITGLSDRFLPKLTPLFSGTGSSQLLYGSDMQNAYQLNKLYSSNGYPTNVTIATLLWSGQNTSNAYVGPYVPSDVYTYLNQHIPSSQPISTIYGYPVDNAPVPGLSAAYDVTEADLESTLDLEMAASSAPGATIVEVYGPQGYQNYLDDAFASVLNPTYNTSVDNALSHIVVISNSWGGGDSNDTAWSQDEQEAAALGITVLASSGDSGNYKDPTPSFPATDANNYYGITAVGGAQMDLNGSNSADGSGTTGIITQSVWYNTPSSGDGSQGGVSVNFSEPAWQLHSSDANSIITGASKITGVASGRGTPDIAGDGANMVTYVTNYNFSSSGADLTLWGTSIASPSVAGEIATMVHYLGEKEGFMDPLIYQLGQAEYNGSFSTSKPFYYISNGSNYYFYGENGYSLAVGWGSINAYNFVQDQKIFVPNGHAVTFSASNLNSGAAWYVNISGKSTSGPIQGNSYAVSLSNGTYQYSVQTADKDYQPSYNNSFQVSGSSVNISIYFSLVGYLVTFNQTNLTSGSSWYVNITGYSTYGEYLYTNSGALTGSTFSVQYPNGTYSYSISSDNSEETATPASGSFTVSGNSPSTVNVHFAVHLYSVEFVSSGLPSGSWYVNISGQSMNALAGSAIYYSLPNGTYPYSVSTTNKIYNASSGSVTVNGNNAYVQVDFSAATYTVQFSQTGLTTGSWYINLSGTEQDGSSYSSQSGAISSGGGYMPYLSNGTYSYSVGTNDKEYKPSSYTGNLAITGSGSSVSVTFSQVKYGMTFTESGLASGNWYVNITGTQSDNVPVSYHSGSISLSSNIVNLGNGTYSYSISEDNGNYAPSPDSGTFQISGTSPSDVNVVFTVLPYTYVFKETGISKGVWYLNISGQSKSASAGSSISYGFVNGSYTYTTSTDNKIYAPLNYSGEFNVSGSQTAPIDIAYNPLTFPDPFSETGLGSGAWYINITGNETDNTLFSENSGPISGTTFFLEVPNGTYSYQISRDNKSYVPNPGSGTTTISGLTTSITAITFFHLSFNITFNETGYSGTWYVNLTNIGSNAVDQSGAITGTGYVFHLTNGTYSVVVSSVGTYEVNYSTQFSVNGTTMTEQITFREEFKVTFNESGLENGTSWYVTINGENKSSTTGSITFLLLNGTYSYSIGGVASYNVTPTSGTILVQGQHLTKQVSFTNSSKGNTPPTNPPSFFDKIIYIIVIAVAVAIVAGAAIAMKRRG